MIVQDERVQRRVVSVEDSLLYVMQRMDELDCKSLLVFQGLEFKNLVSIGDIQRAILEGHELDLRVGEVLRENTRLGSVTDSEKDLLALMREFRMECLPVVSASGGLVKVLFWEDHLSEYQPLSKLSLPVVIMAGGRGTRMRPLTNVIPKPLIPIGEKTILEEIIENFRQYQVSDFFISVNHKADMIREYVSSIQNLKSCDISFFQESKPLGTGGSLSLMKDVLKTTFFVTNCDIIIKAQYEDILQYHKNNGNALTIVSAFRHYSLPYGTLTTSKEGLLDEINEKPKFNFQINTGMYVLEPHVLELIPDSVFFHITELIPLLNERNLRVGVFPLSEKSWIDIGEWDKYLDHIGKRL